MSDPGLRRRRPNLVIFDCDGVLVDSEPIANRILTDALNAAGLALDASTVARATTGHSMRQVIDWAERELGTSLPADFLAKVQQATFDAFRRDLRAVPGARKAALAVHAAGMATCVASSGEVEKMRLTLGITGLLDLFDGRLFSASQVTRGKPAPDLFLLAATTMGHDPAGSVVIEDSLPGVRGAVAAGMTVFGYAAGEPARARALAAAGADVFDDFSVLVERLGIGSDA
jgi:HAD superfamily hydrolase (TIGR01509 family)